MSKYKRNFLKQVICRIDFPIPITDVESVLDKDFIKKIIKLFPIQEPAKLIGTTYQLSPKEIKKTKDEEETRWFFYSKNKEKELCIGKLFMFLSVSTYESFEVLKSHFLHVLDSLFKYYSDVSINRFGLRYINHIEFKELDPTNWKGYLNTKLLSIFEIPDDRKAISRAFHSLVMNYDNMILKFQYGMHNPDFPACIKRKLFVLDFDAYLRAEQTHNDIIKNLDTFHEKIELYFEKSITKKMREVLNE